MPQHTQFLLDSAHVDEPRLPPADGPVGGPSVTQDRVLTLIRRLASQFGVVIAYWSSVDIEMRLAANDGHGRGPRRLTSAEWQRVARTPAWRAVANIAYDNVAHSTIVTLAVRQAGLECAECGATLPTDADNTVTWVRCDPCRAPTTPADILRRPCVADSAGCHEHRDGHCEYCGVPMPPPWPHGGPSARGSPGIPATRTALGTPAPPRP